jgi:hypothetical protein
MKYATNRNQENAMKTIKRTYERTPKCDKLVARVTDKYGDEVFYGDPEKAQRIMASNPKPGQVLRCDTFYV